MKNYLKFLITLIGVMFNLFCFAQETKTPKVQLKEASIEEKHSYTAWRVDYYICTGIAYAKSTGQSVEDFAEFVGHLHRMGDANTATLMSVVDLGHSVMTSYPNGKYEVISETDSVITAKSNRPYKKYYQNGPMLGVTLDEFEKYFWEHIAIMHNRLNMDFKYEIKENEVLQTVSYKK